MTSFSTYCGGPMWPISKHLCGGNTEPYSCQQTQNLYSYMHNWVGDATLGATTSRWKIGKSNVAGDVLCVT